MKIKSIKFVQGVVNDDKILYDGRPQVAFIGRSNVGKSSTINALAGKKDVARTSAKPGRTQEINFFLVDNKFYLVDLPGYGFAKLSKTDREWLAELINWYFFKPTHKQKKVVLIVDAKVGPTKDDLEILSALSQWKKEVVIVANKIDKINKTKQANVLKKIEQAVSPYPVFPFSAKTGQGGAALSDEIFSI